MKQATSPAGEYIPPAPPDEFGPGIDLPPTQTVAAESPMSLAVIDTAPLPDPMAKAELLALTNKIHLTNAEWEAIRAPFGVDEIEVLPDSGLLYVPWYRCEMRLASVLSPNDYQVIQVTPYTKEEKERSAIIYAAFVLRIRDGYTNPDVGAGTYWLNQSKNTFADAASACRSEGLRRICLKSLHMGGMQLYDRNFTDGFVKNFVVKRIPPGQKEGFYRKDRLTFQEILPTKAGGFEVEVVSRITDEQKARIAELAKVKFDQPEDRKHLIAMVNELAREICGIGNVTVLTEVQASAVIAMMEKMHDYVAPVGDEHSQNVGDLNPEDK